MSYESLCRMKKYLQFIPVILLLTSLHVSAQDDVALQTAQGSMMAKNYTSAESNYTNYIHSLSDKLPAYLKKVATYDTCSPFEKGELFPNFTFTHVWAQGFCERGEARLLLGKKDSAYTDFLMAIRVDHKYAEAYYQAALLKKEKGDKVGSCIYLGKAKHYSDTMRAAKDAYTMGFCWMCGAQYFSDGKNAVGLKEYPEALKNLNMAVLLCPDSATYYVYRGAAYDGIGKPDSAMMDYTTALSIDSNNSQLYYRRALLWEEKQKWDMAFRDLSRSIGLNSGFIDAYVHRAEACENMDKEASAQFDYQQIIRIKPSYGDAYYKIALYQQKMGQDACPMFQKAADLGVDDAQGYADECKKAADKAARMGR